MNMNKNDDQLAVQMSDEHETVRELLDACATDDMLTDQDFFLAGQHIATCQQCQDELADISRLHTLFKVPQEELQAALQNSYSQSQDQEPVYRRGMSVLADSVLDQIVQTEREQSTPEACIAVAQELPPIVRPPTRKSRVGWLVGLVAAVLCVLWPSSVSQSLHLHMPMAGNGATATAAFWGSSQLQMPMIRQGRSVFAVEAVPIIGNRDFDIIYAYRSSLPGELPRVKIVSMLPSQPTSSITMKSTIHKLRMLGDFEIGEIHIHAQDRVGQVIILQGTFPDQTKPWYLNIGQQNFPLPSQSFDSASEDEPPGGIGYQQHELPEITVNRPVYIGGPEKSPYPISNAYGYTHFVDLISFTLSSPQKKSTATSMYVSLDYLWKNDIVKATMISQTEYQNLEGP